MIRDRDVNRLADGLASACVCLASATLTIVDMCIVRMLRVSAGRFAVALGVLGYALVYSFVGATGVVWLSAVGVIIMSIAFSGGTFLFLLLKLQLRATLTCAL